MHTEEDIKYCRTNGVPNEDIIAHSRKSEYNKTYLKSRKMVSFVLDKKNDKDVIEWLGKQENQSESIREALRDIAWKENQNV